MASCHIACFWVGWKNTALDDFKIRWKLFQVEQAPDLHTHDPWIYRLAIYREERVLAKTQQRSDDYSSWVVGKTPTTNAAHSRAILGQKRGQANAFRHKASANISIMIVCELEWESRCLRHSNRFIRGQRVVEWEKLVISASKLINTRQCVNASASPQKNSTRAKVWA